MIFNRTEKPIPKMELEFIPPKIEEIKLKNGLKIYFIFKDKLPLIRMNLMINAGSKFDPDDKKGLAYLTSLVMDEGADGLNALELSDEFDILGTNFNVSTDNDLINLSLQCLSENFERSFELFSKVLLSPAFNEEDFLREKKKLITQILQSKDESEYLADQLFDRLVLGDSNEYAFPVIGFENSVQSITKADVQDHYNKFISPSNSILVIVGNYLKDELLITIEKYTNHWKSLNSQSVLSFKNNSTKRKIFLYHKEGSVQTEIRVGHISSRRNNQDYFQKLLLNSILGGQFTSRINLNLRERNGYTYGANSRFQYFKDAGFFQAATSVGVENTSDALREIFFELNNIKKGITDKELEFAKSSITKKFPMNFETYRQIVSSVSGKILFELPDDYFETYIQKINSVSKREVEEMALKSIKNDELTIILVGDKNILMPKITDLGFDISEVNMNGDLIE